MKRVFTTILVFLGFLTVGATIGINAATTPVATFKSADVVSSSTYKLYENANWIVTFGGNNASVGSNSSNKAKCVLGDAYAYVGEPMSFTATTANSCAVISKNPIENVKEINYECASTGNGSYKTTDIYLVSSDSPDSGFSLVGTKQTWGQALTFTVNELGSKYYALVFNSTSTTNFRIDSVVAEFMPNEIIDPGKTYFDVTFDAQNGTDAVVEQVEQNTLASKPETPVKFGFIFSGWYKEKECINLFDFNTELVTGSLTLYAGWDVDPYNYATINTKNLKTIGSGSGYVPYNGSHILMNEDNTKNEFSYTTYQVMVQSDMIQFQKAAGYLYNGSTVKGNIASIKVENLTGELAVYTSDSVIENVTDLTGTTLTAANSVYTVPDGVEHTFFYIKVSGTALAKASAITIQYTYDESFARYSVRFNAGKGVFKEGKGVTLSELEGVALTGNLPTVADLEMTAYKYTNLVGWNDGTKTYAPGEAFEVSNLTVFNAVYEVPENITVDQANEIAALAGTTKTSYKFSCMGIVSSVEKLNEKSIQFTLKDLTSETTISVYNSKLNGPLFEGDKITVTGSLCNFNNTTIQFMDDSSYVINDNLISSFTHTETKSSLKALYDSNFMPVDVDFRFGAKISLNSYNETATYGVMAIDNATFAGFVAGKTEYATADEFIADHAGVKKMACPNGALLEDGYQFAWVMTDMEGHYKTYLTAVIYMEYDGVLYLGVSKIKSVAQQASRYIEDHKNPENTEVILTEEQLKVLQNIISKEA